ncbi:DUF1616 domain-containing protein [Haloarcula laminariae]|uniref:DUF1616 domain-containing protein n=1 Tax=Haloarcula laminariae TaxID=2961577 RepID=UPI0024067AAB|nr:DUF1616 domain-containing protein [Halomicroarcula sp. FL173]
MTDEDGPQPQFSLPTDLRLVVAAAALLWLVTLVPVLDESPLRVAVAVPFALFVPGYALIAALFPERSGSAAGRPDEDESQGIDTLERAVLSFGASIALVPLSGLVLNFTPWGIRLVSILVALTALTLSLTGVAARRRGALPADERYDPAIVATVHAAIDELTDTDNRVDTALNVVLLLSVCLAAGSVAYAVTVPPDGESFTEFYLLTENESGDLTAEDYPENLTTGESQSIVVGIGNQEGQPTNYTVVTELQRVKLEGNQTVVTDQRELDRFSRHIGVNETVELRRQITPTGLTGQRLRLQFRLYKETPSTDSPPYRETHLWVNVTKQA